MVTGDSRFTSGKNRLRPAADIVAVRAQQLPGETLTQTSARLRAAEAPKVLTFKPKAKPAPRELSDLDREVRDEVRAKYRAAKSDYNTRHEAMSKLISETNPLRVAHATEQHLKEDVTSAGRNARLAKSRRGRVGDYPGHPFRGNQHRGGK